MSQPQRGMPSRSGGGGGSVKRARERLEAGLPPEVPQPPLQRPFEQTRAAPSPPSNRPRPPLPPALQGTGPIGVAISRPTPVAQWPLAGKIETVQERGGNQPYQPPAGRGAAPQRPPRPSHVPSMLDASRLQEHTPAFQYQPQVDPDQGRGPVRDDEDPMSPPITSPMTQSSRPSTISSVGTIPDFPVPVPPPPPAGPPRRSANLGPPPSARRGASSYYSQASYVSPIPEESPRTQPSHLSYASSAAIPTSWGSHSPGSQDGGFDEDERGFGNDVIEEGRESRESNMDDNEDRGLIRSASLGKRAKPSMIMTKSSERSDPQRPSPRPQQKPNRDQVGVREGAAAGALSGAALTAARTRDGQREMMWPIVGNTDSPLASGTGLIDKSTSSSENEVPQLQRSIGETEPMRSDSRASAILGAYNSASSLQPPGTTPSRTPSPGFSRLSAIRRPPRLDIDAVRDAEARGSLTSLPDLIRRATRLAAMMDRGRRPGSRLHNLSDFASDSDLARDKEMGLSDDEKRQSGFSGMLAAFPPPGLATPVRGNTPRPASSWPIVDSSGSDPDPTTQPQKRRRCCGLPCWGFFLLLLLLVVIIAAAVVVPLELLVINKPKTSSPAPVSALQACEANVTTACQNGGASTISTGRCACICINGFTGSTCSATGSSGCTTITISTDSTSPTYPNVTLGDAIPRLIAAAQTNFSVPLFSTVILARFNSASLSCISENALVTFDGFSQRIGSANNVVRPSTTETASSASTSSPQRRRQEASASSSSADAAATLNGIVYDPSSAYTATDTTPAATSAAAASQASASPNAVFAVTEEILDFARVAILFVLQQEELDAAVTAQGSLQHFFSLESFTNKAAQNVSLGNGNTANLLDFSINLGNGSVGSGNGTTSKRSVARRWMLPNDL